MSPSRFTARHLQQQRMLKLLYQSPRRFDNGLLSFHYPLYVADDAELEYFLGSLAHSVSHAVSNVAHAAGKAVGGVAKSVGKVVSTVDKVIPTSLLTTGLRYMGPAGWAIQ